MTKRKILMAPSMLSADFARLSEEIRQVEEAGADWLHVDVMDGHFVPNLTVGPVVVKALKKATSLPLDVHLMIENPEKYVSVFADHGSDMITFHLEACPGNAADVVRLIKRKGCRAGLSVRPKTPVETMAPYLKDLDLALVMTVEPEFGGQSFMPDMAPKVAWLRRQIDALGKKIWLEVDGGINAETAPVAARAGADVLVAGNAVFGEKNRAQALRTIRRAAEEVILS